MSAAPLRLTRRGRLVVLGLPLGLLVLAFFQIAGNLGGSDGEGDLGDVLAATDGASDGPALRVAATYAVPSGGFLLDKDGPAALTLVTDAPVVVVGAATDPTAIWLAWQLQAPLVAPRVAAEDGVATVTVEDAWNTRVVIDVGPSGADVPSGLQVIELEVADAVTGSTSGTALPTAVPPTDESTTDDSTTDDSTTDDSTTDEPTTDRPTTDESGTDAAPGQSATDGASETSLTSPPAGSATGAVRTLADVRVAMASTPDVDLSVVRQLLDASPGPRTDRPFTALVRPDEGPEALVPMLLAGALVEQTTSTDLFETDAALVTDADGPVVQAGAVDAWADVAPAVFAWQRAVLDTGVELPGGGHRVFGGKRYIAMYGSPETSALGVLGEQDVTGAVDRSRGLAGDYDGLDALTSVPAWDLIATVASGGPEPTEDYSRRVPQAIIREWVDVARDAGVYVVLDLQSGRTDFLTQAKELEEFLIEPHVGLALDPEWRLKEDQVHLVQIGSVTVDEVNEVGEWLATLTRENALPEKLFMVHQFTSSMFRERERFADWPEIAEMVQMDGQGTQPGKLSTWEAIIKPDMPPHVVLGWKNFYDEDPETLSPEGTVALDPSPEFVSYQ